jgi:hypothetical protein
VDGITRITIEAITTDIPTVVITTDTVTTGVTICTGPGFPGLLAIIAIGKRMRRYAPKVARSPLFEIALVLVRFDHVARRIVNANHR